MAGMTALYGASGRLRAAGFTPQAGGRVVVVGAGFAGCACALWLRQRAPHVQVTLVDPQQRYVTCPMSNEALVGWRSLASITVSRAALARASIRWVPERAVAIEPDTRRVRLAGERWLPFDRLVIAPGIRMLWNRIEGYDETAARSMPHAWQAGEQTLRLAQQLRSMDDGGVVAISVPTGPMRCPPAPYERASVIAAWLAQHKPRSKVLIFDGNNYFPRQDVFTDAWGSLYPGKIEWIASTAHGAVHRVDPVSRTLYTDSGAHPVAVANVIPPQAPGQIATDAGLASDHGWCPVDPRSFESSLVAGVHVIGDACIAGAMPKSASAACSQARQCAQAVAALLSGNEAPSPQFDSVCYSFIAPGRALAIHGQFAIEDDTIVAIPAPAPSNAARIGTTSSGADARQARSASQWYRDIRLSAFGD
jgi:NADPH-dependent 2,4-dienoyl-CoA reductase/sulfur reductase-like enzyme